MRHLKLSVLTGALCLLGVAVSIGWSAAATLTGMSVSTEGEVTRIHVMLDEPVEFSHFDLSDPARVFVDCLGVDTILPKKLPAGHGRAESIEASVWNGAGYHALTRITIDLTGASKSEVQKTENGLVVILGPEDENSWSPEELVANMIAGEPDPPAEERVASEDSSDPPAGEETGSTIEDAGSIDSGQTAEPAEDATMATQNDSADETATVIPVEPADTAPGEMGSVEPADTVPGEMGSVEPADTASGEMGSVEPADTASGEMGSVEPADTAPGEMNSEASASRDEGSREDAEASLSEAAASNEEASSHEAAPVEKSSGTPGDQDADHAALEISSQDTEPADTTEELTSAEESAEELSSAEEDLDYSLPDEVEPEPEPEAGPQEYYYQRTEPTVTSIDMARQSGLAGRGGARVSLDIQGADIYTVLRSISEYSGVNIVMGYDVPSEIKDPLSYHLENVPWGEALEMVLRSAHLGYREEGNFIRVDTEENLRNEELARTNAARQLEEVMPLSTRIVQVVYANARELKPAVERSLSRRGVIEVDARTNSILVTDIDPRVTAAVDMIRHLDSQTPQVEIVAKLVDVDARSAQDLGVLWGVGGIHSSEGLSVEGLAGANDVVDAAAVVQFGVVRSWGTVSALLSALVKENKANIISNPRVTTVNNREARILVGKKIPLIVLDEAGNAITELVTIGITLRVTPHINDNNRITLDLHPEVSDLAAQATVQGGVIINTSEADTRVMVENGETAVIGGLIRSNETRLERGIPIIKDIPLIGSLFKNTAVVNEKRELLIFVTPRIINSFAAEKGQ